MNAISPSATAAGDRAGAEHPAATEFRVALQHHYGWQVYTVLAATLAEAAYKAVRLSHPFLTEANHTHTEGPRSMTWGGKPVEWTAVTIDKNEASPAFAGAPGWVQDGPGALWFGVKYRAALPGEVNAHWMTKGIDEAALTRAAA